MTHLSPECAVQIFEGAVSGLLENRCARKDAWQTHIKGGRAGLDKLLVVSTAVCLAGCGRHPQICAPRIKACCECLRRVAYAHRSVILQGSHN